MNQLANKGVVEVYAPLMDAEGSYSAQFEHVCSSSVLLTIQLTNILRRSCWGSPARRLSVAAMTTRWSPRCIWYDTAYMTVIFSFRWLLFLRTPSNMACSGHSGSPSPFNMVYRSFLTSLTTGRVYLYLVTDMLLEQAWIRLLPTLSTKKFSNLTLLLWAKYRS